MSWLHPTIEELKLVLAEDEIEKLQNISSTLADRIQAQLDAVTDLFRAAFISKGYVIDERDHYIDAGYLMPCLNLARYQIWSTFPASEDFALTEPRKELYEAAKKLLENPYLGTSDPDPDPLDPTDPEAKFRNDPAIAIPYQRFPSFPYSNGFWGVYTIPLSSNNVYR